MNAQPFHALLRKKLGEEDFQELKRMVYFSHAVRLTGNPSEVAFHAEKMERDSIAGKLYGVEKIGNFLELMGHINKALEFMIRRSHEIKAVNYGRGQKSPSIERLGRFLKVADKIRELSDKGEI